MQLSPSESAAFLRERCLLMYPKDPDIATLAWAFLGHSGKSAEDAHTMPLTDTFVRTVKPQATAKRYTDEKALSPSRSRLPVVSCDG
jgi:hypothetical protein